jgi:hypothetical protein
MAEQQAVVNEKELRQRFKLEPATAEENVRGQWRGTEIGRAADLLYSLSQRFRLVLEWMDCLRLAQEQGGQDAK